MTDKAVKKRRRSGTAAWHMSMDAVSVSIPEIARWTDKQCLDYLVQVRFGAWDTISCPHCGTLGDHYWRKKEKRWKCEGCGSTFSITSGTVFASRKKSLNHILTSVLMWVNSAAGQPALELKRHMKTTYNTAFTLRHKMREALVRGYNVGFMNGDVEMDGAHQSGRRSAEKRGKPQATPLPDLGSDGQPKKPNETLLTQTGKMAAKKAAVKDPEYGGTYPESRRIMFAVRKRSGVRGKGASKTRVAVGLSETSEVAESIICSYVAVPESYLNTDSMKAYDNVGKQFRTHRKVNHGQTLVGPHGENNNQAEELNGRFDRAEKGIYLNIEPKYMLDYACETAFRSDTRRLDNGRQLKVAMGVAMAVGESLFLKGFTHGKHRLVELTHPEPLPAAASGPEKGRSPISSANGRPPR